MVVGWEQVLQRDEVKATDGVDQQQGEATIAVTGAAVALGRLGRLSGSIGVGARPIGAAVVDEAGFGITGGSIAAYLHAGQGITGTAFLMLVFGRAGAPLLGTDGLVATVLNRRTAHVGSGFLEHAIGADQRLRPGFRAEQPGVVHQGDRSGQDVVEILDGYLDARCLIDANTHGITAGIRLGAQSGEKVAHPALSRQEAIREAKARGVIGVARLGQVGQGRGPVPLLSDLPALEQKQRHRVKWHLTTSRPPAQPLRQNGAQAREIDQA